MEKIVDLQFRNPAMLGYNSAMDDQEIDFVKDEIDEASCMPPNKDTTKLPSRDLPQGWSFNKDGSSPRMHYISEGNLFFLQPFAHGDKFLVDPANCEFSEARWAPFQQIHPSGKIGLRTLGDYRAQKEVEVFKLPVKETIRKWPPYSDSQRNYLISSLCFDLEGQLWIVGYSEDWTEFRVDRFSEEADWNCTATRKLKPPRDKLSDYRIAPTYDPGKLIIQCGSNWDSFIYEIRNCAKPEFIVECVLTTNLIPFITAPILSPDLNRYLIGNADEKFGIHLHETLSHTKIGFVEWPGVRLGFRSESGCDAVWLDDQFALVMNSQGRLFLLDSSRPCFVCTRVPAGKQAGLRRCPAAIAYATTFGGSVKLPIIPSRII